ncbi:hypothetical protein AS850_03650 [Frondihabitans sp. 762G35]|uniref:glycosyltransferase family 39 protein n=1 Tax=Frondihabitans sp. 762G35 TaxID=1446794 RepID=UPI000D208DEF|nr:glycosyltransferase family 39 protein [Frondihabitans sp. 762G35]ARC56170.1 hypothetical protein AS850_03650 [Frondihabitans sp. 762G35]
MTDLRSPRADDPSTLLRDGRASSRGPRLLRDLRARPWGDPLLAGVVGFAIAVAFSWVPSIWYDESATIVSARRSWSELWTEIQHVDAVHALYYALMHGWLAVVGYSPFTLRLPSALAVGVAAALVAVLARTLAPRTTGLLAGLLFTLLPRVTWMGTEARSYALTATFATLLTLVFVIAVRRSEAERDGRTGIGAWRWWLLYGAVAVVASTLFIYTALVVVAHGVTLVLAALAHRSGRRPQESRRSDGKGPGRAVVGWLLAAVAAGILLVPLVALARSQQAQVSWLPKPDSGVVQSLLVTQWFPENPPLAVVGWAFVIVAVTVAWRRWRGGRGSEARRSDGAGVPGVAGVALPWLLLPALVLVAVSVLGTPLYTARYLSFSTPALGLLMAAGVARLRDRRAMVAVVAVIAVLSAGTAVWQRLPEAKDASSWKAVAALVARERAAEQLPAGQSDAIVYGGIQRHPGGSTRSIAYAYPAAFDGMTDVTLDEPAAATGRLWETRLPFARAVDRVDGHPVVWLVTRDSGGFSATVAAALRERGFRVDERWHFTEVDVVRFVR